MPRPSAARLPETENIPLRALDALPFASEVRQGIQARVLSLVTGGGAPPIDYDTPPGDPGLFGPQAVCWRVHSDFTSMMVGGIAALLLQMLHPLALAGVVDHSNFRRDMQGRLRRTASFVAGTTYGNRHDAEALIARVRKVHRTVVGTAPDGRPYSAEDPALLTWVHVAEVTSFLQGYLVYVDPDLAPEDQDRYLDETALVAEMLGARGVPRSRAAADAYLATMRPVLAVNEHTRDVTRVLLEAPAPHPAAQPLSKLFMEAGIDLLPAWAQALSGLDALAQVRRPVVRRGVRAVAPMMRWALRNGAAARARRRCEGASAR